jgi:hypothetical protein
VGGSFSIIDCPAITSLEGFENIESIDGELKIHDCPLLNDIDWIADIDSESITHVEITNNPLLSYCSVTSVCEHLIENGSSSIQMNSAGCDTADEIIEQCNVSVEGLNSIPFSILSNVVKDELQVMNPMNVSFTIYNQEGRMVLQSNLSGNLSLNQLASGMYTLLIDQLDTRLRFIKE